MTVLDGKDPFTRRGAEQAGRGKRSGGSRRTRELEQRQGLKNLAPLAKPPILVPFSLQVPIGKAEFPAPFFALYERSAQILAPLSPGLL